MQRRKHKGLTHARKVSLSGAIATQDNLARVHAVHAACLFMNADKPRSWDICRPLWPVGVWEVNGGRATWALPAAQGRSRPLTSVDGCSRTSAADKVGRRHVRCCSAQVGCISMIDNASNHADGVDARAHASYAVELTYTI
jgi:hypothetical protein